MHEVFETSSMIFIDGVPYYPIIDIALFAAFALAILAFALYMDNREQKRRIVELQNLVDYYYEEDLIK